ncbi:MAG: PepSY-associated TM helix domain-containing protein [Henriciella sp.]|nr:PepSY-associated TM helix domain-containing protein [Henriciella sp.]
MTRRYFRHTARRVHAACGAALSLLLIVIALTGSLLVFKADYIRLVVPEAQAPADLSVAALADVTEQAEAAFGPDRLRALVYATPEFGLHKVYLTDSRAAYLQSDGAVLAEWGANERFEDWLFDLHHRLLAGQTGLWIAGFAGLAASGLVITGLIAVWPMRRGLRRGLKLTQANRGQLLSVHRNLGVWAAAPVFALLLSGTALAFPSTTRAMFDMAGGPAPQAPPVIAAGELDWAEALNAAEEAFPGGVLRMAVWPRDADGPITLRLRQAQEWHPNGRSVAIIDPATSRVAGQFDATEAGPGREAYNALYPIHAAHIGGRVYDFVVFVSGIALTLLGVFGLWAFVRRWA